MPEATQQAIAIMVMATPFMFGVLTLFSLLILALSRIQGPSSQ